MNKHLSAYFLIPENDLPQILDLRDLEAPEPMQKTLMACTKLEPDENFLAHFPHVPAPLFPHLESRGLDWQVFEEADGSAIVLIRRKD